MSALGLIETQGLLAAIEASDVMLKTAEVNLLTKELVGGGLVTVIVTGDVGAVKTAVNAAASSVERLGKDLLCSKHVIARPDESLMREQLIISIKQDKPAEVEPLSSEVVEAEVVAVEEKKQSNNEAASSEKLELSLEKLSEEELKTTLSAMKIVDLRKLAKKQPHFSITNKDIYKINKEKLIEALSTYFNRN
ncbi:BMC domain-containing protein [Enterococcus xiangfangensis]|uniref:BMC domain-containing protein n=1 Tax=Enterococcus xiangfangensis TaxID=1296537 RepID=A0ABU3FCS3_9ENTE|nr:BMC domain-containing protein [Enterococcus xiangfangensis]MBM7712327.1 microcompartment protein CcmL/EutN [Enterococcus xiangfangensis]MDT2760471.1 BMC domain-containing protein [Enterococcus xiangfangensis]NBK08804.1 BMC domain-containing protein [Enterococcus asini]